MHPQYHTHHHHNAAPALDDYDKEEYSYHKLMRDAGTNWRVANAALSSAVDNLMDTNLSEHPQSPSKMYHQDTDDLVQLRWDVERQHTVDDAEHLRQLAQEFAMPHLRLGLHNRDEPHPMFSPLATKTSGKSSAQVEQQHQSSPQPWLSLDRLVASRIHQESQRQEETPRLLPPTTQSLHRNWNNNNYDHHVHNDSIVHRKLALRSQSPQLEHETVLVSVEDQEWESR